MDANQSDETLILHEVDLLLREIETAERRRQLIEATLWVVAGAAALLAMWWAGVPETFYRMISPRGLP